MAVKKLHDIEVYPNYFLVALEDVDTKEVVNYTISEMIDDRKPIYNFFTTFDGFLITFNGIHYDNMVVNYLIRNYKKFESLSSLEVCKKLKAFSDAIIIGNDQEMVKGYKNYNPKWMDIDLYLYWSLMLRKSKKISLKSLGIQLNHEEIQELPFDPNLDLTIGEQEEIRRYNNENDLGILRKLFDKQIEEVRLRRFIKYEYGLECWSFDAPKIASEILLMDYCEKTDQNPWEVKNRASDFSGYYGTIGTLLKDVRFEFKTPVLQEVYEGILKSRREFKKEFVLNDKKSGTSLKISLGIGGIHSLVDNKKYISSGKKRIVSSDVQSLYPNLIINYNLCRYPIVLQKYKDVKVERVIAKKEKLKQKDTLLKLILNSFSGLIDNTYSWLYYPEGALKLRMLGQLLELKALDECIHAGIEVIALNTDSIDVLIEPNRVEEYYKIIDDLGLKYNVIFEHEEIAWTHYKDINNYLQKAENGKVKRKGMFKYGEEIPLGDSVNQQIIPKALELYFDQGIPVSESISNPEKYGFHIYDYCLSKKISRDYEIYHNGKKIQNLNRYYFTKNAPYLFKKKLEKKTHEYVHVKEGVTLFNKYKELSFEEYNINYAYYIKKANDIIYNLEKSEYQLSLF